MVVRPAQFWLNPTGNLAEEYSVYIGVPNQDPTQPSSQITVMDGLSGAAIAQPFIVTNGIARNTQGQQILPTIIAQRYSIKYVDNDGVEIYSEEDFFSDAFGIELNPALTADKIYNNLQDVLIDDLDGLEYIYVKSSAPGWEGTPEGPDLNAYYYYTGGTGPAGTIDNNFVYDALGNEWKIVDFYSLPNEKALKFKNDANEPEGEGAFQVFNGPDDILRIQKYVDGAWVSRYAIGETTQAFYDEVGSVVARIREGGTESADDQTIITREKGDARYGQFVNFSIKNSAVAETEGDFPSGWSYSVTGITNGGNVMTITHNLNKRIYPQLTYYIKNSSSYDDDFDPIYPPALKKTGLNDLEITIQSGSVFSSMYINFLAKI